MKVNTLNKRFDVNILGMQVSLPNWARYIAIDENGTLVVFSDKPLCDSEQGIWCVGWSSNQWEIVPLQVEFEPNDIHWMDSLVEIKNGNLPPYLEIVK